MTWNRRVLSGVALVGLASLHIGCAIVGKWLTGRQSHMVSWDRLPERYAPSDSRDLAWLAQCDEIHIFTGALSLAPPPEYHWVSDSGVSVANPMLSDSVCDYIGRALTDRLQRLLPDQKVHFSVGVPGDGAAPEIRPGSVAICFLDFQPRLHLDGHMILEERPAIFYPMPPDRSPLINEACPEAQRTPWRAQPGIGAKRACFLDRYTYQLATRAERIGVFELKWDLATLEEEICRFAGRRVDDLTRQVEEAVRLNAGSERESKSPNSVHPIDSRP